MSENCNISTISNQFNQLLTQGSYVNEIVKFITHSPPPLHATSSDVLTNDMTVT